MNDRKAYLNETILSISGWRRIFSLDGVEDSLSPDISEISKQFICCAAYTLAKFYKERRIHNLLIAQDSRPTGKLISQIFTHSVSSAGIQVKYIGVTAIPEAMAHAQKTRSAFVYFTASHNPPGYNGLKIGDHEGKILKSSEAQKLIQMFIDKWMHWEDVNFELGEHPVNISEKIESETNYKKLLNESLSIKANNYFESIKEKIASHPISMVYDFNGSGRLGSIDQAILREIGIKLICLGDTPGKFTHRIVPEGSSLKLLTNTMAKGGQGILFGLCVDGDGDRGNFVLYEDEKRGKTFVPSAQFSFYLSLLSELIHWKINRPHQIDKIKVVANGPTSLCVQELCDSFGVDLVLAEVGEANINELADRLSQRGYFVPILGEGSNGGTIIRPGTVRDPIMTLLSVLRLIFFKDHDGQSYLKKSFSILGISEYKNMWENLILLKNHQAKYRTTSVYDDEALLKIKTRNHADLKKEYEHLFKTSIQKQMIYQRFGFSDHQIINYEGAEQFKGQGNRHGAEDGGFKVLFLDENKAPKAFIWMRGSRTEPVFRIMADIRGNQEEHDELLKFHRDLILAADKSALT